jgi:fucose permease
MPLPESMSADQVSGCGHVVTSKFFLPCTESRQRGGPSPLVTLVLATSSRLLTEPARPPSRPKRSFALRDPRLVRLGLLAFLALFAEGVLLDWSVVFAATVTGAPVAVAPIGFAAFAVCMAAGRFLGDVFIARLGSSAVLRISGGPMLVGTLVATLLFGLLIATAGVSALRGRRAPVAV